jgi:hypothetical protein
MCNHSLAWRYVHLAALVLHSHHSFQHDGEFVEFRRLSGFFPTLRAAHVGDADAGSFAVDASNEFIDPFGFGSSGGYAGGLCYESWHQRSFEKLL